ncbi:MAG TPA: VOC family protein [Povalibacter sp.]|nr:VOC family protein [Povalibacter sp.]
MRVEPYLYFDGRCEEAIEFYRRTLGAEISALLRFKEGGAPHAPGNENRIMHVALKVGDSTVLASDGQCQGKPVFQGFSLALSTANDGQAERWFAALSVGGRVQLPLGATAFASRFGMVADRFGVLWTVVSQPPASARA